MLEPEDIEPQPPEPQHKPPERQHHDLEVPEADEIEQRTAVLDTDTETEAATAASLPDEAAEGDALEQRVPVEPEDEYPPV